MPTGVKVVIACLIVIMPACSQQVPSTSNEPIATVAPFALPPTWTPIPTLPPIITPTRSPVPTSTLKPTLLPTIIPTSMLRRGWFLLTELAPTEPISLETAKSFIGIKIPPLPENVVEEFVYLYPDGGELPSWTITYQAFVMRLGNARMLWTGAPFAEGDPWSEGRIYDAIPLPPTQAGDIVILFTCSRDRSISDSLLIVVAARPQEGEPATEIHYAWSVDPTTITLQPVNDRNIECWSS